MMAQDNCGLFGNDDEMLWKTCKWEFNIKICLKCECEGIFWLELAWDKL
jgi:hypothetical protein